MMIMQKKHQRENSNFYLLHPSLLLSLFIFILRQIVKLNLKKTLIYAVLTNLL